MVERVCVFGLLLIGAVAPAAQPTPDLNPVGKWTVSTVSDEGQPMTVTMDITGKPGAYTGQAVTSLNRTLPLRELATTPTGLVALFDLPQGGIVVRIVRDGNKFIGAWGAFEDSFALTAERKTTSQSASSALRR
jgi:hypothetical protein